MEWISISVQSWVRWRPWGRGVAPHFSYTVAIQAGCQLRESRFLPKLLLGSVWESVVAISVDFDQFICCCEVKAKICQNKLVQASTKLWIFLICIRLLAKYMESKNLFHWKHSKFISNNSRGGKRESTHAAAWILPNSRNFYLILPRTIPQFLLVETALPKQERYILLVAIGWLKLWGFETTYWNRCLNVKLYKMKASVFVRKWWNGASS